ncbi:MAG: BatA domain-containing protein [Myxococcales bacterium]|nr:BatA domain-containing protein [Myxococcales bacterium]MCB9644588.1 BatA domain-containing protein [Myxococcales bacterium]
MNAISFLQPAFLYGLLAIAVPIIIHLLSRRRAVRWPFAAMEFLLRSHRRVARRLRLKQLLLLLLRCLLIAGLAFAFAKPFFKRAQGSSPAQPGAYVLILDDSMSMQYREAPKGPMLFDRAREAMQKWIQTKTRGEDRLALLRGTTANRSQRGEQTELTFDKKTVIDKVKAWQVTYQSSDLAAAIMRAQTLLLKQKGVRAQVIVFSDFTQNSQIVYPRLPDQDITVRFFPVRPLKAPSNRSILSVQVAPAPYVGQDAYQFDVTLRNFSAQAINDLAVTLVLNEMPRARGFAQIPAWGTTQKRFVIQLPQAGNYAGYVQIAADGLPADDRFFFSLKTRKRPSILLVNGDSRPIPYLDELFYITNALRDEQLPFQITIKQATADLPPPQKFDVIALANIEQLPTAWQEQLKAYVEQGGGLLFTMGNQVRPEAFNLAFSGLLPRQLRGVALAAQRPDGTGIALQRHFGEVQANHPIFQKMYRDGIVFQSARASKLMLVETRRAQESGEILWRFSHGPPALLERKVGKGRVLLLTTSIDRDWTDLPIRPFFQPWLQRVFTYLAGGSRFHRGTALRVAQKTRLQLPGQQPIRIVPPKGLPSVLLRPEEGGFPFEGAPKPGTYKFEQQGKPLAILPLSVNIDPAESDIRPLPDRDLQKSGEINQTTLAGFSSQSERLWPFILLALLLIFTFEAVVLRFL